MCLSSNANHCSTLRLELRRLRADLLRLQNILYHFVNIGLPKDRKDDFFTISSVKITRGNSFKLIVPHSRVLDACSR